MFSVIFDMDGTLTDTQRICIPAWDYAGELQGFKNMGALKKLLWVFFKFCATLPNEIISLLVAENLDILKIGVRMPMIYSIALPFLEF